MADITRAESETDPNRCQGVAAYGQCVNKAMVGSTFCLVHGGPSAIYATAAKERRNYRLTKWQARLEQQASAPQIKSLREEIGILRMLMEERLNTCTNATELLMYSQPIAELVLKIEHVVASCHKLEEKLNIVVDRQAILQFASEVITAISEHVTTDVLQAISDKILLIVGKVSHED